MPYLRRLIACLSLCLAPLSAHAASAPTERVKLLPQPTSVRPLGGSFRLGEAPVVFADPADAGANAAANYLGSLFEKSRLPALHLVSTAKRPTIRFVRDPSVAAAEGYRVHADPRGVTVAARTDAGLFYGAVTIWQLATSRQAGVIPSVDIEDAPRFGWRGLMLDSARHFQSVDYVKHLLDWMAVNKLNSFHWHLVDDQGWRIEIPKYPKLTEVSGWRHPATARGAPQLPAIGGFYTQDQIRDVVAYAAARHINVVPEIEMPGHALAAIRAYPELGTGTPITPNAESDYGVFPWLYNVDEPTFTFIEDVLTDVMKLFPSTYIHVGGDEAVKDQWKANAAVQARMKSLGIKDETAMQSWFTGRIERFLTAHGRRLIGWDEILEGGIAPQATVMSWRGVEGAEEAAKQGHDAVLSPAPILYFDNRQGWGPLEPPGRGNLVTLEKVYGFEPVPASITASEQHHILGLQANLWTEHVSSEERASWMLFPRASAIAEIGWSAVRDRNFPDFMNRLIPQMERMQALGLRPAISALAVTGAVRFDPSASRATVTLANQANFEIRYRLDGQDPSPRSEIYREPLLLPLGAHLRAAAFHDGKALPGAYDLLLDPKSVRQRSDEELKTCTSSVVLALEDDYPAEGPRPTLVTDIFNPCWIYEAAPVGGAKAIAIDVGQIAFNFQVGKDVEGIKFRAPRTPAGEFEVRGGSCDGPLLAVLPLAPAVANPGITRLTAPISAQGSNQDLCISYTAKGVEPEWAIERVELIAG